MRSLLRLLPYFSRYRKMYLKGVLLVILSSLSQILWPTYLGKAVNSLVDGTATPESLALNAALIVLYTFLSGFFYYLVRQNVIVASRKIESDLRSDLLAHLERLSMRFYQNTPQGEVMAYMTNDIDAVRYFVGPSVMYTADTLATFVAAFSYMLALNPTLAIASVVPLPLMSIGVYFIGKRVHPLFDAVQSHYATLTARATESLSGIRVVRAYVRERYEETLFNQLARGYFDKNMRLQRTQGLMQPVIFVFMGLSSILLVLLGGRMIIDGKLTIGGLTQFFVYLGMLTWPFIALGYVTNMIQRGAASMARLIKIFETEPEIKNSSTTDWKITSLSGPIEFHSVVFRHRPTLEPVIRNVSLTIPEGATIAIMGRTGAGKTTFVNLIARLIDPTEGSIHIGGHDLRTIPIEVLRSHIGFITQEPFLFSETIEENIRYGSDVGPEAHLHLPAVSGLARVEQESPATAAHPPFRSVTVAMSTEEAARAADVYENIMEFPDRFQTMIGERGVTLSGGQKQRTAIARALARNPRLLILDDAMSAVDTATEERILRNLRSGDRSRTAILISHRTSTAKEADWIVVFDNGVILEQGTHTQLLELQGAYHELYKRQLLEDSLASA